MHTPTTPVVFLHIAKTAGTSLVAYLRTLLPPGSVLSHGDFLQFPGQRLPAGQLSNYKLVSGHFGYSQVEELLAGSYSLTILRDPLHRVLSLYKFLLHEGMQKRFAVARTAARLPVDEFFCSMRPEVVEMLDNQQCWQIADDYWMEQRRRRPLRSESQLLTLAKEHLQQFSLVGFTETFEEDFASVLRAMSLPVPDRVPRLYPTPDPLLPGHLKDATLATLEQRLALDYELVAHARTVRAGPGPGL